MRVVVIGCGAIGSQVAAALWKDGHEVVVLDLNPESFCLLPAAMREDERVALRGDGTADQDLLRAGIMDADVCIAAMSKDTRNLLVAQKAKHMFKVPRAICRVDSPVMQDMYQQFGIITISTTRVVTGLFINSVLQ
ncbi:MAG: TrkA family potassium uptake protein [SAR202 cluster bacterium]|nr:TrkA family potassium uptake protein [SAR202 cluster bacterium]